MNVDDSSHKIMRHPQENDLTGKTIQSVDISSVNHIVLFFTDGSRVELWAEIAVLTEYGNIPGIFIEDVELNSTAEIVVEDQES